MIPRPLPYLHVVEPHEKPLRDDPDPPYVEPYKHAGLIRWALYLASAAVYGVVIWRLL